LCVQRKDYPKAVFESKFTRFFANRLLKWVVKYSVAPSGSARYETPIMMAEASEQDVSLRRLKSGTARLTPARI